MGVILLLVGSLAPALARPTSSASPMLHPLDPGGEPGANGTYAWSDLSAQSPAAPSPRSGAQAAYSPALGEVILFGGYDISVSPDGDTWAFSSDHWTELFPVSAPPGRWGGEMVYDASDGYLLLFGGRNDTQYFNDTWAYNATGWHQIPTTAAPSPRGNSGLTYDLADGNVVLFGGSMGNVPIGSGSPQAFYNDTWTYHAGTWTNVSRTAGTPPSARWPEGMTFDPTAGYVALEGGASEGTPTCAILYNDTWDFSGGRWTPLSPGVAPPPSYLGGMVFDSQTNSTLLYLGALNQPACNTFSSEVWTLSTGDWNLSVPTSTSAPPGRASPVWVDDPADHGELLFGGDGAGPGYNYLNDTWILLHVTPLAIGPEIAASRPSADVGQMTSFQGGAVSGGQPPYTYSWQGLPTVCGGNTTSLVDCTFTAPSHLEISLIVSDSLGQMSASAVLDYTVYADPTFLSYPSASADPVSVGNPVTFSANVSGGSGGFTFGWRGLPAGCASIDAPSLTCSPTQSGTFDVSLRLNDSNGENATSPVWPEVVLPASAPPASGGQAGTFLTSPYFLLGAAALLVAVVIAAWVWARRAPPGLSPSQPTSPPRTPPPMS